MIFIFLRKSVMIRRRTRCSTPHLGSLHLPFPPMRALCIPHSSPKSTICELIESSNNRWLPLKIGPKPEEDINQGKQVPTIRRQMMNLSSCVEKLPRTKRKHLKRIMALEKQHKKPREELQDKKKKSLELQQELVAIQKARKKIGRKWRHEMQAKELAKTNIEEELKFKEEADANLKRQLETAH